MNESNPLKYFPLKDLLNVIVVNGRTNLKAQPLPLFWNGSGIETYVNGSELWIDVEVSFDFHEPWVSYEIDGAFIGRQMLLPGRHKICLYRNMSDFGRCKHVNFTRELQAMSDDVNCHLLVHGFYSDGNFCPCPRKPYRIEFIGDSITSGEGSYGPLGEHPWVPMFMSVSRNYTSMTAKALNAEYRVLSQGGWGVYCGWDNDIRHALPPYYDKVCSLGLGQTRKELGGGTDHDFSSWQPHIIVINLGTNDCSAFDQPAWTDPSSGISYKQRKLEDGSFHPEDVAKFEAAAVAFLKNVRSHNPLATIVWAYGMLGYNLTPCITHAIHTYTRETKDNNVHFFHLPNTNEETVGCNFHPGVKSHEKAASCLSEYLQQYLPRTTANSIPFVL